MKTAPLTQSVHKSVCQHETNFKEEPRTKRTQINIINKNECSVKGGQRAATFIRPHSNVSTRQKKNCQGIVRLCRFQASHICPFYPITLSYKYIYIYTYIFTDWYYCISLIFQTNNKRMYDNNDAHFWYMCLYNVNVTVWKNDGLQTGVWCFLQWTCIIYTPYTRILHRNIYVYI